MKDNEIPPTLAIGIPMAFLGAGVLSGVYQVFKRENVKFKLKTHIAPAVVAFKALSIGTFLCLSTFSIGIGMFSLATGIQTVKEFGDASSSIVSTLTKDIKKPDSANEKPLTDEEKEILKVTEEWVEKILNNDKLQQQQRSNQS